MDRMELVSLLTGLAVVAGLGWRVAALTREMRRRDDTARHDPLTGLPNRRGLGEEITERLAEEGPEAPFLLLFDLERFKAINDLHGRATGDRMIRHVAACLRAGAGPRDIAARLGGDEFALLLAGEGGAARAERLARRLLAAIARPVQAGDVTLGLRATCGAAEADRACGAGDLLGRADAALVAAKRAGRGSVGWFDAELRARSLERTALEADLGQAILRGDIVPHFEPVHDLGSGTLRGFEVLARWFHATRGEISPTVFIPIAEETGTIATLGWSVIGQALRAARDWDPRLRISVNVSPVQVSDETLVARLREVLVETGFDPRRLEIEVTETAVIADMAAARAVLEGVRALGVSLALDDFGTGFSSLSSLRQLPFDRIKIDRSFVAQVSLRPSSRQIVTGILALARSLEMGVTAEGIETEEDLAFLRAHGCELGQGYLLGRAVGARDAAALAGPGA